MSDRASSSKTPPSPYVTRSGRVVKSPSLLLDDQSSFTDKPAESKKRVTRVMKFEERKNQKRMEVELKESEGESDSDEEEELSDHRPRLPGNGSYGSSSDDSSLSSFGYCQLCDCPGPKGLLCNAGGCEDSNCIYE